MVDRLIPYKGYSYERDLIEYGGAVVDDSTNIALPLAVYATPGVSVVRNSAGNYTINLTDKMPLYAVIANSDAVPADLSCIDKGFASSCMIWVSAWPSALPAATDVRIGASQVNFLGPNQVYFDVVTYVTGVPTDISWSFRIWVTGQPAKFVQGLGA